MLAIFKSAIDQSAVIYKETPVSNMIENRKVHLRGDLLRPLLTQYVKLCLLVEKEGFSLNKFDKSEHKTYPEVESKYVERSAYWTSEAMRRIISKGALIKEEDTPAVKEAKYLFFGFSLEMIQA